MCGIFGYLGERARENTIVGLKRLEYRGYDSAGIATLNNFTRKFDVFKDKGRVSNLEEIIDKSYPCRIAIAHTRWATTGEANKANAHPHISEDGRFIIVHNGIITNYEDIKKEYLSNVKFKSETDTEVLVDLIMKFHNDGLTVLECIKKTMNIIKGNYAFLLIDSWNSEVIFFAKKGSPLLLGRCDKGYVLSSDTISFNDFAKEYVIVGDEQFGALSSEGFNIYDKNGEEKLILPKEVKKEEYDISMGSFEYYMLKEIYEEPKVIDAIIDNYFNDDEIIFDNNIIDTIKNSSKITFVGNGSSYNAGCLGKCYFETISKKESNICYGSELLYDDLNIKDNECFIFLSQSGETIDSINCIKKINKKAKCITITNFNLSTMARLSDYTIELYAGNEVAVASTKTYVAEAVILLALAYKIANKNGLKKELILLKDEIKHILVRKEEIKSFALELSSAKEMFIIGKGLDFYLTKEASLKFREVPYLNAISYPSGELKHGPLALIDEDTPVLAIVTNEKTSHITRINLEEAITRHALGFVISSDNVKKDNDRFIIKYIGDILTPLALTTVIQLLSYEIGYARGNDIDKPKNIAKCVTVD